MYLRSTPRRNKDGSEVRYLQLVHNVWDPAAKRSRVQVVHNFGREDQRPGRRWSGWPPPSPGSWSPGRPRPSRRRAWSSRSPGRWAVRYLLDALWERLGIGPAMRGLLKGRRLDPGAERVLFALVANRALAPSSKLAAARWASEDVLIAGLPQTTDDACYRAMDWLLQIREALEKQVFDRASELLGLEVDLLFFDTTSTYFVTEEADAPVARDQHGNPVPDGAEDGGATQDGRVPDLGQVQGPPR